jgi:hypothetical protein
VEAGLSRWTCPEPGHIALGFTLVSAGSLPIVEPPDAVLTKHPMDVTVTGGFMGVLV